MNRSGRFASQTTPLAHSKLRVLITDLVAEYELRHVFSNQGKESIEAVYSFPVPLDSAFMGMEASLAGEHLVAQILPRQQANTNYDDAIADGNSAVLLERLEPGMLCVNLGNLKPGEDGEIVLHFASALQSADGSARFSLPLVHRPRYGRTRLSERDEPENDFAVEHPLEAVIRVRGLLSKSPVSCATHGARFSVEADEHVLRLNQAMLDRDLVLGFELPDGFVGQGRLIKDENENIGMLTFTTSATLRLSKACDLCLVLDGSGSMSGDAISQSRAALRAVAEALSEDDHIQVLRFGSSLVPLFRRPMKASTRVRDAMVSLAESVNADLGGTEIGSALKHAIDDLIALGQHADRSQAIILVTDGAVQPREIEEAKVRAIEAGIRIFVVAVGSSAGADVLAPLSALTNAVLERAVPAEPIDESVMRQLRRARDIGPLKVEIDWGSKSAKALPLSGVYAGDAVTAFAMLPEGHRFEASLTVGSSSESQTFVLESAQEAPALRALAGHAAWQNASSSRKEGLAMRYGLVTDETSAVLVKIRADGDQVQGFPVVVPVKHMLSEGMVAYSMSRSLRASARLSMGMRPMFDLAVSRNAGRIESRMFCKSAAALPVPKGKFKVVAYQTDDVSGRPIIPNGYKPSADEEYMSALQLEYFRQRLLSWRAELVHECRLAIDNLKKEMLVAGDVGARASTEEEDSMELHTRDRYRKLIVKIDATLKRLDCGDYGYCVDTGEEIGLDRLEASLTAERTLDAHDRWEHLQKQMED